MDASTDVPHFKYPPTNIVCIEETGPVANTNSSELNCKRHRMPAKQVFYAVWDWLNDVLLEGRLANW